MMQDKMGICIITWQISGSQFEKIRVQIRHELTCGQPL
jgi:hypothetical protein